jgi:hypothetical protein
MEDVVRDADIGNADTKIDLGADASSLRALAVDTGAQRAIVDPRMAGDVEVHDGEEEEQEEPPRRVPLRSKVFFGASLVTCLTICVIAVVRGRHAPAGAEAAATAAPAEALPAPQPQPQPPPQPVQAAPQPQPQPVVPSAASVAAPTAADPGPAAPPDPKTATIALSSHARSQGPKALFVDGKRAKSPSVEVTCGKHSVAVGKEKARHVDVPCGRTAFVDVGTTTITKSAPPDAKGIAKAKPKP